MLESKTEHLTCCLYMSLFKGALFMASTDFRGGREVYTDVTRALLRVDTGRMKRVRIGDYTDEIGSWHKFVNIKSTRVNVCGLEVRIFRQGRRQAESSGPTAVMSNFACLPRVACA